MSGRIAQAWAQWEEEVLGPFPEMTAIQRHFVKQTFYAGAKSMWSELMSGLDVAAGTKATGGDMQHIEDISAELRAFSDDLR